MYHHGPRPISIICYLRNPPTFLLPTTFKRHLVSGFSLPAAIPRSAVIQAAASVICGQAGKLRRMNSRQGVLAGSSFCTQFSQEYNNKHL